MAKKDKPQAPSSPKPSKDKIGGTCTRATWCSKPNGHGGACSADRI